MRHEGTYYYLAAIVWVVLVSCGSPTSGVPTAAVDNVSTETMSADKPQVAQTKPMDSDVEPVALSAPTVAAAVKSADNTSPVDAPAHSGIEVNTPPQPVSLHPLPFEGETSLKERIADNDIIVRASVTSVVGAADGLRLNYTSPAFGAHIDFHLRVHEYLKGSGPDNLIAVVWQGSSYDTREKAQAYLPTLLASRNSKWEDRQAIIFLSDSIPVMPRTEQSGYYYLAAMGFGDDMYSLDSMHDKQWLPAATATGSGTTARAVGDTEFLLDAPGTQVGARSGGTSETSAPTITLTALKELVTTVEARMRGSEQYKECVRDTFLEERLAGFFQDNTLSYDTYPTHTFVSGQAKDSVIWQDTRGSGYLPEGPKAQVWLHGGDTDLFVVTVGPNTRVDDDGDGTEDRLQFDRHVVSARPLPAGEYRFQFNERGAYYVICEGWVFRYEWTVTATAPAGVLHEAFFDPVNVGTAVKADGTNGVLKPASFTDANSASATLQSLSYEPPAGSGDGTVKLQVDPHTGLVGRSLDFIELDGSVSLSLRVADAAVDAASKTLSWSVASQPWDDGDKLMLRIQKATPPAPKGLGASLANGSFTISWSAVTGADQYRVGYRTGGSEGEWTNLEATTGTSQAYSPGGGVACGTTYEFRVQARGDGTTYAAEWGATSEPVSQTTGACNSPPVFGSSSYSFSVAENASVWDSVGIVSATDPDEGDSITYHITAGNEAGRFDISSGRSGGLILVWGALDYETVSSYTLTVEARDGKAGGTSSATVEITVTDVDD